MKTKIVFLMLLVSLILSNIETKNVIADNSSPRAAMGTGGTAITEKSRREIERVMTDVVEQVIDKDVEGVIDNFTKSDRERIVKGGESTPEEIKQQVSKLKANWEAKFNHPIRLSSAKIPYEITRSAENRMATVVIPLTQATPKITLNLVEEGTVMSAWRISVPQLLNNQSLKSELAGALKSFNQDKDNWPANENEAYHILVAKLLTAIVGLDV